MKTPRVGEVIQVPYGLDTVPGLVLEVYGPPGGRHVLLELDLGEGVERFTVSLRLDELTRSSAA